ncbi:MAG: hypothetical protein SFX19_00425 [Alphaproteobacteria bacterium]|nr:hypothetical protein [Alphaproteobacteria bacterium]
MQPASAQTPPQAQMPGAAKKEEKKKEIFIDPNDLTSIFFTSVERDIIGQARTQYSGKTIPVESELDLLDQLQDIKAAKKPDEELQERFYAQFYLKSLLYHTPSDWLLWLKSNDSSKKFTPEILAAADIAISIIQVKKEEVTFEWTPKNWLQVSNAYTPGDPAIMLDQARHVVIFTLRVNQTITANDMRINEGVVNPKELSGDGGAPLPADAGNPLQNNTGADKKPVTGAAAESKKSASSAVLEQLKSLEPANKQP